MTYWLYITNSTNWKVTQKTNILGASEKHRNLLSRMKTGDICLVYIIQGKSGTSSIWSHIVAEYEVVSDIFEGDTSLFQAPAMSPLEEFPLRIRLRPLRIFESPIAVKPLVQKLAFVKNKQRWALSIRGRAVVQIPEHDYKILVKGA